KISSLLTGVRNVERAVLAHPANPWLLNTDLDATSRDGTKMSPRSEHGAVLESQDHVVNPTNPSGALDDGVEDRLHVRGRAADDPEHFGCCSLMLQCLAQFCIALLQFFKQPDVFDGDDCLSGKSLKQLDLSVGERTNLRSSDIDYSDRSPLSEHRRAKKCPDSKT